VASVVARRVDRPDVLWVAVRAAAATLTMEAVDYPERRRRLATFDDLPPAEWVRLARRHSVVATPSRRRCAAAWLWAEAVGGDWRDAPALTHAGKTAVLRREAFGRFLTAVPPSLLEELRSWPWGSGTSISGGFAAHDPPPISSNPSGSLAPGSSAMIGPCERAERTSPPHPRPAVDSRG
jgi:hypothetical protein